MSRPLVLAVAMAVASFAGVREAAAYCRTTTCNCPKNTKPLDHNPRPGESLCPNDCPRDEASTCQTKGNKVAWKSSCISYSLNIKGTMELNEDQWRDTIMQAFAKWQAVDCGDGQHPSINLIPTRDVTCAKSEYLEGQPNVNVIYFSDTGWTDNKAIDETLALTKVHFSADGEITDADMALNSAIHDFTVTDTNVKADLLSIVTHEAGHFLGLDHSNDTNAVMYFSLNTGDRKPDLQQDDIDAICEAYPPGRAAVCDSTPKGGFGDSCDPKPKLGCAMAPEESPAGTLVPFVLGVLGVLSNRIRSTRKKSR